MQNIQYDQAYARYDDGLGNEMDVDGVSGVDNRKRQRTGPTLGGSGPGGPQGGPGGGIGGLGGGSMVPGVGGIGGNGGDPGKRLSRARSDSAPLGYGTHHHSSMNGSTSNLGAWNGGGLGAHMGGTNALGRPRSGSGLSIGMGPRIPNIGNMMRNAAGNSGVSTPLLSIPSIPQ